MHYCHIKLRFLFYIFFLYETFFLCANCEKELNEECVCVSCILQKLRKFENFWVKL